MMFITLFMLFTLLYSMPLPTAQTFQAMWTISWSYASYGGFTMKAPWPFLTYKPHTTSVFRGRDLRHPQSHLTVKKV